MYKRPYECLKAGIDLLWVGARTTANPFAVQEIADALKEMCIRDREYIKEVYEHLQYYYQMAMGDGQGCVREFNIEDFWRKFKYFPVPVDSALKILTQAGYLEYTDEQDLSLIHILI